MSGEKKLKRLDEIVEGWKIQEKRRDLEKQQQLSLVADSREIVKEIPKQGVTKRLHEILENWHVVKEKVLCIIKYREQARKARILGPSWPRKVSTSAAEGMETGGLVRNSSRFLGNKNKKPRLNFSVGEPRRRFRRFVWVANKKVPA